MRPTFVFACTCALVLTGIGPMAFAKEPPVTRAAFRTSVRMAWTEHAQSMRLFMSSAVAESPEKADAQERLTQVQSAMSDTVRPFYGDVAADKLASLLNEHTLAAGEIVTSVLREDRRALALANAHWYGNADALADHLSSLNPKAWPKRKMRAILHEHVNTNAQEVVAILNNDPRNVSKFFDRLLKDVDEIAELISRGVERQFPERFR